MNKTLKAAGITLGVAGLLLVGFVGMAVIATTIREYFGMIGNLIFAISLLAFLLIGVYKEVYKSL